MNIIEDYFKSLAVLRKLQKEANKRVKHHQEKLNYDKK